MLEIFSRGSSHYENIDYLYNFVGNEMTWGLSLAFQNQLSFVNKSLFLSSKNIQNYVIRSIGVGSVVNKILSCKSLRLPLVRRPQSNAAVGYVNHFHPSLLQIGTSIQQVNYNIDISVRESWSWGSFETDDCICFVIPIRAYPTKCN